MARPPKHIVSLTDSERDQLSSIAKNYRYSERERNRAQILLQAEQGHTDLSIATQIGCHWMTVRNARLRFSQSNPENTLSAKQRIKRAEQVNRAPRALDGEKEAHLIALICSEPPTGANRWTLQLVKDRLIEMQIVENIGKETIRRTLKKTNLSLGRRKVGAFPPPKMPDL